ncbi:MAG: hypothetical protein EBU90_20930 [Proteobacteria bacterium]|nr:hypothetical protein [Pseudomonadota bacterium]
MKKEIAVLGMILFLLLAPLTNAAFAAEEKKVCVKELDNKTKKEKEVCKTIKIHKKLEGTAIPPKK